MLNTHAVCSTYSHRKTEMDEAPRILIPGLPAPTPNAEAVVSEVMFLAARAAHEANRAWCKFNGDDSQLPWDEAPDWVKMSAYSGASSLLMDPEATAERSHESWVKYKKLDGWKYGTEKSAEKKTHPCLVPYDELPSVDRFKDELFIAVVSSVLSGIMP